MQEQSTMTLRELCRTLGVSHRAVQGYESHNLLSPSGKSPMGHLIYDADAQRRVQQIHQYQKYGFQLREIAPLLNAPTEMLRKALVEKLVNLEHKQQELDEIIRELRGELQQLT